jgi:hypothetical protein
MFVESNRAVARASPPRVRTLRRRPHDGELDPGKDIESIVLPAAAPRIIAEREQPRSFAASVSESRQALVRAALTIDVDRSRLQQSR